MYINLAVVEGIDLLQRWFVQAETRNKIFPYPKNDDRKQYLIWHTGYHTTNDVDDNHAPIKSGIIIWTGID